MYKNIRKKADGSFIVNFNGLPFHVTTDYPEAELYGEEMTYEAIAAYAAEHPEEVTEYSEPVAPEKTTEEIEAEEVIKLHKRASELSLRIHAALSEQDVADSREELKAIMIELSMKQIN